MIKEILFPRSVAIVGVSSDKKKIGHTIARNILRGGFAGRVYFVNPRKKKILGKTTFSDVTKISSKVDLAIVSIPCERVFAALQDCRKKGVKNVIIISAGFSEVSGAGRAREEEIFEFSKKYNMRILGPNCLGILNSENSLNASFAPGMIRPGNIACLSQSGALCCALVDWAQRKNVGFTQLVSLGNKMMLDEVDFLEYFLNDSKTQAVFCYLEGIARGAEFLKIAKKVTEKKPLIILKSGVTAEGQKAAASHTASLTSDSRVIEEAFSEANIIQAHTLEEFFSLALFFHSKKMMRGENIAVVSNAGGPGVVAADIISQTRLHLSHLSEKTLRQLRVKLPAFSSVSNPVDVGGDADHERYRVALENIVSDNSVDGVLVLLTPQSVTDSEKIAREVAQVSKKTEKPVVANFLGGKNVEKGISILEKNSVPAYGFLDQAMYSLEKISEYERRKNSHELPHELQYKKITLGLETFGALKKKLQQAKDSGGGQLRFSDWSELLRLYEIPFVPSRAASSPDGVLPAVGSLKYPLAAKIDTSKILHKSDLGLVVYPIKNPEEAKKAFQSIQFSAHAHFLGENVETVLFQQYVGSGLEFIVGAKRDPVFGPVILAGAGGVYVEVLNDVSLRLAPVGRSEARQMLERLKIFPILSGARSKNGYDKESLVDLINKVSQIMIDCKEIQQIDLNPAKVMEGRGGVLVLDCRIIL